MRVLHVLAPARFGGLETVVQSLALGLRARDHDTHVAVMLPLDDDVREYPFLEPLSAASVHVHEIRAGSRAYLKERADLAALCARVRPHVVHTHGYHADLIAPPAARSSGAAVVTTVHGFTGGGWRNRVYEYAQRRAFRSFDAVIAVSSALNTSLVRQGVSEHRVCHIPNAWPGASNRLDRAAAREHLNMPDGLFHIGWVGRISKEKGADIFIDALARMDCAGLRATIVGSGPEQQHLTARARDLGLSGVVSWAGAVPNAGSYFSAFDLFVLSSRTEGMPMVLFEAMASEVPIVATAVGGVRDLEDDVAAMVSPVAPQALADALASVRDGYAFARQRARQAAERLPTVHGRTLWIERHEALYNHLRKVREAA